MKIQNPRVLTKEDLRGAPAWAGRLLGAMNTNNEQTNQLMQNQLSSLDNMNHEIREFTVFHGVQFTFTLRKLRGLPREINVGQVISPLLEIARGIGWATNSSDNRRVDAVVRFESAGAGPHEIRILIEGD